MKSLMKKRYTLALGAALAAIAGASVFAMKRTRRGLRPGRHVALHGPADELEFEPIIPGVSRAVLWGDPDRGAYAAFSRFEPGAYHRLHTHPHDITLVVLSGAYIYGTDDEAVRV